jgi:TonB family protein
LGMCWRLFISLVLVFSSLALPKDRRPTPPIPSQFAVGRHTFFDFGPPNDFYELFLVRPSANGTAVERITLTPAADSCFQPASIEVVTGSIAEIPAALLGMRNPCAIPEKELRRERKRCKKCLVFSGAHVVMQVQCGAQTRTIRSDILDRDMFDPAANTPKHTSWTMQLLARLDHATGPGVMDRPAFGMPDAKETSTLTAKSDALEDVKSGRYDAFFEGAPDKLSDLYRAAQVGPTVPTVRLVSSSPFQPVQFVAPGYPPIVKLAHIEGMVTLTLDVDANGNATNVTIESGHPMLRETAKKAVSNWQFPQHAEGQHVQATIEFKTNCSADHK